MLRIIVLGASALVLFGVAPAFAQIECIETKVGTMCTDTTHRDRGDPGAVYLVATALDVNLLELFAWDEVDGAVGYQVVVRDLATEAVVLDKFLQTVRISLPKGRLYGLDVRAVNQFGWTMTTQYLIVK